MHGERLWAVGTGAVVLASIAGCGAPPPPPPVKAAPPANLPSAEVRMTKEPLQTGKPCLTGEAACGGGVCDLTVKSTCEAPVTCDVFVASSCRSPTGVGEARGRKRGTFAPNEPGKLNAAALCVEGDAMRTSVTEMKCQ